MTKTHENTTQHERSDIAFTLVIQASDSAENQSWNNVSAFLRSFSVGFDSDEWTTQVALGQQSLAEHELSRENCDLLVELLNVAQSHDHTERMLASDWLFAVRPFELQFIDDESRVTRSDSALYDIFMSSLNADISKLFLQISCKICNAGHSGSNRCIYI